MVTDIIGTPPDEVVLAPPNTVLKTSSGKIRRNASRDIYERGLIGKPQKAVWLQVARFTLKGLLPKLNSILQRGKAVLYSGWCWTLYGILALVTALLVLLLPAERPRWQVMRQAVGMLAGLTRTKILVQGRKNLPAASEACIFIANHASYLDGYLLTTVLDRPFSFIAKAELKKKPLVHFLLKRINTIFVERFDQKKSLADAKEIAEIGTEGRSLLFFPEGTFARMPGLLPFRMGAFEISARTGLPVVPVAIRGTRSILRADSWFPRHGMISVTIGSPIRPQNINEGDTWTAAMRLRDEARQWILAHCGEPDLGHEQVRPQKINNEGKRNEK
jgi:1-acyl-sn-glycerol-3-phosphate acyltransferase